MIAEIAAGVALSRVTFTVSEAIIIIAGMLTILALTAWGKSG
jgi:hypothetical protein